ncbi:PEP-CTERM sorting domain-containing protein [Ruficoccus amylovorans]|uniref:PEP-CTERM sorting domain-containing protein n=1 Tax=Ruficoccus amylovorans TaxID=1804625 RepID=A0A842HKR0_9BACT|nr:PEP-CTERM sorting domain-containing protein [Ruficoccus amylovorans]MBC2595731.1 PEP-CTERM sorting domain-containing protein [Ruficoccus amylovorans]
MKRKTNILTCRSKSIFAGLAAGCLFAGSSLFAANVNTYWTGGGADNDWANPDNWDNGAPSDLSGDGNVSRAFFNSTSGAVNNVDITGANVGNYMNIGFGGGTTVNLNMASGSSLSFQTPGSHLVGSNSGAASILNVTGPVSGSADYSFSGFQIGTNASDTGSAANFSGALNITDSGANTVVGRQGNGHTLTVSDGAIYNGKGMLLSGTQAVTSGVGNDNSLVVTGAGSAMTLSGLSGEFSTLALIVASRPTTGLSSSVIQSGNIVTVSDGASLTVIGDNPDATVSVLVGANHYRRDNGILVTGSGSTMTVSGDVYTQVGYNSSASDDNYLKVENGATFKTDATVDVLDGITATTGRNYLLIDNGGTFTSSSVLTNTNGLLQLAEGGVLAGKTLAGDSTALTVNVAGSGRFEAAGTGLGNTVTVNFEGQVVERLVDNEIVYDTYTAVFAVGLDGATGPATVTVDSTINLNENSILEIEVYGNGGIDSIILGSNAEFNIGSNVMLSILMGDAGPILEGDYNIFTGNIASISGDFTDMLLPELDGGKSWDTSRFNAADGWVLSVVPEPSTYAVILGAAVVLLALVRRKRK